MQIWVVKLGGSFQLLSLHTPCLKKIHNPLEKNIATFHMQRDRVLGYYFKIDFP